MKRCLLGILFILSVSTCVGQEGTIMKRIVSYYNNKAYDSLYSLIAPAFKEQFPRSAHDEFYNSNIRVPLGAIKSFMHVGTKNGLIHYKTTFEKGDLSLFLLLGRDGLIESMQWQPYQKQKPDTKREWSSIKSNNLKKTPLELKIDSVAKQYLENRFTSGLSIGIVRDGQVTKYFYGETKRGSGILPDENTIYEIGSITKTFTGLLLAKAVRLGKIALDDDIRKYLPGSYPNLELKGQPILVKHLSNHTSRLPANPSNLTAQKDFNYEDPFRNYDYQLLYESLNTFSLDTLPGTKFEYSNMGVGLLGAMLSKIYNKSLDALYEDFITNPMNMKSTKVVVSKSDSRRLATGHNGLTGDETPYWNWADLTAAGGLKSSINDMILYLNAQMGGDESITLSHTQTYSGGSEAVGLNWMLFPYKNMQFVYHDGRTSGFSSIIGFIKENKTGIVVLSNSGVECNEVAFSIMRELLK